MLYTRAVESFNNKNHFNLDGEQLFDQAKKDAEPSEKKETEAQTKETQIKVKFCVELNDNPNVKIEPKKEEVSAKNSPVAER